jgi:predicted enzyme related to lactoylglutathione lyase
MQVRGVLPEAVPTNRIKMKIIDIAFVCYAVKGLKSAQAFYEGVLGLKPTTTYYMSPDQEKGLVEYDLGGGTFSIGCGAPMFKPGGNNVAVALEVEDFPAAMQRVSERQVKVLMEATEQPGCSMALIEDPDGNPIMFHRRKNR